jgi:hypothetical protein
MDDHVGPSPPRCPADSVAIGWGMALDTLAAMMSWLEAGDVENPPPAPTGS